MGFDPAASMAVMGRQTFENQNDVKIERALDIWIVAKDMAPVILDFYSTELLAGGHVWRIYVALWETNTGPPIEETERTFEGSSFEEVSEKLDAHYCEMTEKSLGWPKQRWIVKSAAMDLSVLNEAASEYFFALVGEGDKTIADAASAAAALAAAED